MALEIQVFIIINCLDRHFKHYRKSAQLTIKFVYWLKKVKSMINNWYSNKLKTKQYNLTSKNLNSIQIYIAFKLW